MHKAAAVSEFVIQNHVLSVIIFTDTVPTFLGWYKVGLVQPRWSGPTLVRMALTLANPGQLFSESGHELTRETRPIS